MNHTTALKVSLGNYTATIEFREWMKALTAASRSLSVSRTEGKLGLFT